MVLEILWGGPPFGPPKNPQILKLAPQYHPMTPYLHWIITEYKTLEFGLTQKLFSKIRDFKKHVLISLFIFSASSVSPYLFSCISQESWGCWDEGPSYIWARTHILQHCLSLHTPPLPFSSSLHRQKEVSKIDTSVGAFGFNIFL